MTDARLYPADDLVDPGDLNDVIGLSRQRINLLRMEDPGFPDPIVVLSCGPIWSREDLLAYVKKRSIKPRKPGGAIWDRKLIVEAIQSWAAKYGAPPAATEWNPAQAKKMRVDGDDVEKRFGDGYWPYSNTVINHFGTWGAAIEAAGFPRPIAGQYDRAIARDRRADRKAGRGQESFA